MNFILQLIQDIIQFIQKIIGSIKFPKKQRKKRRDENVNIGKQDQNNEQDHVENKNKEDSDIDDETRDENNVIDISRNKSVVEDHDDDSSYDDGPNQSSTYTHIKFPPSRKYIMISSLIAIGLIAIALLIFFLTSLSDIKEIEIKGDNTVTQSEVLDMTNLNKTVKYFDVNSNDIEQKLKSMDEIKTVQVTKQFPNKISIKIKENSIVGYVLKDELILDINKSKKSSEKNAINKKYIPILSNGKPLMDEDNHAELSGPLISKFKQQRLTQLAGQLSKIEPAVLDRISEVIYKPLNHSNQRIQLYMNDGVEVIGELKTIGHKMNYYDEIVDTIDDPSTGYIDFEVGSVFRQYEEHNEKQSEEIEESNKSEVVVEINQEINDEYKQLAKELRKTLEVE